MSSLVYATGHIKDPVPLIAKRRGLSPGGRFPPSFIHQVIIITGLNKLYNCMFSNLPMSMKPSFVGCLVDQDLTVLVYDLPRMSMRPSFVGCLVGQDLAVLVYDLPMMSMRPSFVGCVGV